MPGHMQSVDLLHGNSRGRTERPVQIQRAVVGDGQTPTTSEKAPSRPSRKAVIGDTGREGHRLAHLSVDFGIHLEFDNRGGMCPKRCIAAARPERPRLRHDHHIVDEVVGPQGAVGHFFHTVGSDRPSQLLLPEVRRYSNHKYEPIAARQKMGGLPPVSRPRRKHVVVAYRDVRPLPPVSVHITEHEVERAVRVRPPALERGRDRLAARIRETLGYGRVGPHGQGTKDESRADRSSQPQQPTCYHFIYLSSSNCHYPASPCLVLRTCLPSVRLLA